METKAGQEKPHANAIQAITVDNNGGRRVEKKDAGQQRALTNTVDLRGGSQGKILINI